MYVDTQGCGYARLTGWGKAILFTDALVLTVVPEISKYETTSCSCVSKQTEAVGLHQLHVGLRHGAMMRAITEPYLRLTLCFGAIVYSFLVY